MQWSLAEEWTDGTALAQAVYDAPSGEDATTKIMMMLNREGGRHQRVLYSYTKNKGYAERWNLLRFIKPDDVSRTALLTLNHPDDESDQWVYLPALDHVRRIASSRKGGRFVASDFYYEDLSDREVKMDHHKIIGKDIIGKTPCVLLESIPVEASNSVYKKRVSCVHPKILVPLRIDFYEHSLEKPTKRLKARKIKKVQGIWTVFDSTMYNLKNGSNTKLEIVRIAFDQGLPDELFSQRGLVDESREFKYRPDKQ